jgi:hypothetical protein
MSKSPTLKYSSSFSLSSYLLSTLYSPYFIASHKTYVFSFVHSTFCRLEAFLTSLFILPSISRDPSHILISPSNEDECYSKWDYTGLFCTRMNFIIYKAKREGNENDGEEGEEEDIKKRNIG